MSVGASLSNYNENLLLNWVLTNQSVTRPTSWYLGLFTDSNIITDEPVSELVGAGYSRLPLIFSAASNGSVSNTNTAIFTADGNWTTVKYVGIFDAQNNGHLLFWGSMSAPKTLELDDQLQFAINSITISLD
jgi:hypothetical protein